MMSSEGRAYAVNNIDQYERVATQENQQCGFQTSSTQIGLYHHRGGLEAVNFRFRKKSNCTILVVKTKALISFAAGSLSSLM